MDTNIFWVSQDIYMSSIKTILLLLLLLLLTPLKKKSETTEEKGDWKPLCKFGFFLSGYYTNQLRTRQLRIQGPRDIQNGGRLDYRKEPGDHFEDKDTFNSNIDDNEMMNRTDKYLQVL